jgi:p-aminobenzoyl-glutamate transporter AbgT
MPAIEFTLNLYVLLLIVFVSFLLGFWIRKKQIKPLRKKVYELEKEMLSNHAEILELQRTKALLEQNIQSSKIPVIPLNPTKEEGNDKALRK